MKQFRFWEAREIMEDSVFASRFIGKWVQRQDRDALLAVQNHRLMGFYTQWAESAIMETICPVQTAIFRAIGEKSALFQKRDCFDCLSPVKRGIA